MSSLILPVTLLLNFYLLSTKYSNRNYPQVWVLRDSIYSILSLCIKIFEGGLNLGKTDFCSKYSTLQSQKLIVFSQNAIVKNLRIGRFALFTVERYQTKIKQNYQKEYIKKITQISIDPIFFMWGLCFAPSPKILYYPFRFLK